MRDHRQLQKQVWEMDRNVCVWSGQRGLGASRLELPTGIELTLVFVTLSQEAKPWQQTSWVFGKRVGSGKWGLGLVLTGSLPKDRSGCSWGIGHKPTNLHCHIFLGMFFMENERVAMFSGHPGFLERNRDSRINFCPFSTFFS